MKNPFKKSTKQNKMHSQNYPAGKQDLSVFKKCDSYNLSSVQYRISYVPVEGIHVQF